MHRSCGQSRTVSMWGGSFIPDESLTTLKFLLFLEFVSATIHFMSMKDMKHTPQHAPFKVGDWTVHSDTGRLVRGDETVSLEPKVMGLLMLLAGANGAVLSRREIEERLWAGVVVGEDTVARTVSRLRAALGDSAKDPAYIETLPRRGYRLLLPVTAGVSTKPSPKIPVLLAVVGLATVVALALFIVLKPREAEPSKAAALTARANDLYIQFTQQDNETAIALYEKALALDTDLAAAQAGLANALVQRVIRWPSTPFATGASSVQEALSRDMHQSDSAMRILARATALAERAVRLTPRDADALKALGLVYAMQNRIDLAEEIYLRAIEVDETAWESMVNLSEIYDIKGDQQQSVLMLEAAFETMGQVYDQEPQRVGPWQAAIGALIGKKKEDAGRLEEAELWYRRTLEIAPYEPEATKHLAAILRQAGDEAQAEQLCSVLVEKLGPEHGCEDAPVAR